AYFYGGPTVARRLQVSEDAVRIRDGLIASAINDKVPVSSVAIAPQGSQIIGVAPVFAADGGQLLGVVVATFYMDQPYIDNISQIINTDVAIVKDNAVIVSSIDPGADYEDLINQGWLKSSATPSLNVTYSDGQD